MATDKSTNSPARANQAHPLAAAMLDARSRADDFSMKLDQLKGIVELVAFACEARRVLDGIEFSAQRRPVLKEMIDAAVDSPILCGDMRDASGDVLQYVARQLEDLNTAWTRAHYDVTLQAEGREPNHG